MHAFESQKQNLELNPLFLSCFFSSEDGTKVRNPYRWLPRKEEKDRRDKKKKDEKRASSPSQVEIFQSPTLPAEFS